MARQVKGEFQTWYELYYADNNIRLISEGDLRDGFQNVSDSTHWTTPQGITDTGTLTWDTFTGEVAYLLVTGTQQVPYPDNMYRGQMLSLIIEMGTTGGHSITWHDAYNFPDDTAPELPQNSGEWGIYEFRVYEFGTGEELYCTNQDHLAFHRHISGQINNLTEETGVQKDDIVIIEDQSDSWNKKKAQIGDFPLINNQGGICDMWTGTEEAYTGLTPSNDTIYFVI